MKWVKSYRRRHPGAASGHGIRVAADGAPDAADLAHAAERVVLVEVRLVPAARP